MVLICLVVGIVNALIKSYFQFATLIQYANGRHFSLLNVGRIRKGVKPSETLSSRKETERKRGGEGNFFPSLTGGYMFLTMYNNIPATDLCFV